MAAEDYIIRFTDPARSDGELLGSTFIIKPFTVNGPQHPIIDANFTDPETGNATSRQSPIVLYGKGIPEYGEQMANNLLQVAENFAGSSAPTIQTTAGGPLPGITWFQDEKYWVDTVLQNIYVWSDATDTWINVTATTSWSTNAPGFDLAANRSTVFPTPVTGDYFYATDTNTLSVYYVWTDFTPTIQAWLTRISRNEAVAPAAERPRRTLSVYDPTDTVEDFVKLVSYKGNDVGDPMTGPLFLSGDPTALTQAANKNYVDTEILAAIGGSNQLHEMLDVDSTLDASTGNTPPPSDNQFLVFDTALAGGGFDGLWTSKTLVAADVTDFSAAADARIAAAIIDDLSDVNVTNGPGIDGFALVYNDTAGEWQAAATAAIDTFVEYNNEPGAIVPYSVVSSTGFLTLNRNDAQIITVDNITPLGDYLEHVNQGPGAFPATNHISLLAHDADVIDWTAGALTIGGTPTDVEQAIQLLDAAIVASAGGYTAFTDGSNTALSGSGESPANTIRFRSGNNILTTLVTDDDVTFGDNVLFTVVEANIDHNNLLNSIFVDNATVRTTDATVTTLQAITIPTDTERVIVARVRANEAAVSEVSTVDFTSHTIVGGDHWTVNAPGTSYYVWYTVDAAGADPAPGGTGIQVDILSGDSAAVIATKTQAVVDLLADFNVPVPGGNVITVTNAVGGPVTDATAATSGVIIVVTTQGATTTDDSLWAFIRFGVKNVAGTASLIGGVAQDNGADVGAAAWVVAVDVTGTDARIRVTGEAAHIIDWTTSTEVS